MWSEIVSIVLIRKSGYRNTWLYSDSLVDDLLTVDILCYSKFGAWEEVEIAFYSIINLAL